MKITITAIVLLGALHSASSHWLDADVARSNALQSTWKAAVSPRFQNVSRLEIVAMMGVPMQEHEQSLLPLPKSSSAFIAVPDAFSVYEQWPQCLAYIADQGNTNPCAMCVHRVVHASTGQCGSCWAFGTGGSFADRLCIASNGSKVGTCADVWVAVTSSLSCPGSRRRRLLPRDHRLRQNSPQRRL
jgi:hypothetical protein